MVLPRLYAIVDAEALAQRGTGLREFAEGLRAGGVELVQWRAKQMEPREVLEGAAVLREVFAPGGGCRLVMNDRVDLALLAGFDGVHVGQDDLGVEEVRAVVRGRWPFASANDTLPRGEAVKGSSTRRVVAENPGLRSETWGTQEGFLVGVSTHTEAEVRAADAGSADYVAVGPVFATGSKPDAAAVVGLEGVRRARALTGKALVAIGGITQENAASVVAAGADAVAVISGLFVEGMRVADVVQGSYTGLKL